MLRFLREHEVAGAFKAALAKDGKARIAVAFWGLGAARKLGLRKGADVQVLCNLDHIGCNPRAIQELLNLSIAVKTHPRLHGKVYGTTATAIVGSSNASTNGLTVEGDEAIGWKEGNLFTDDRGVVADTGKFFDELWGDAVARAVDKGEIDRAIARRGAVPPGILNPPDAKTLLAACRERPDAFAQVIVCPYDEGLSKPAKQAFDEFKEQAIAPEPGSGQPNFRRAWAYQSDAIPSGAWVVDLDCKSKTRPPKVWGCSQFLGYVIELDEGDPLSITCRGQVSIGGRKFAFPPAERAFIEAAGLAILKAGQRKLITLADAIRIADKVAAAPSKGKQ